MERKDSLRFSLAIKTDVVERDEHVFVSLGNLEIFLESVVYLRKRLGNYHAKSVCLC